MPSSALSRLNRWRTSDWEHRDWTRAEVEQLIVDVEQASALLETRAAPGEEKHIAALLLGFCEMLGVAPPRQAGLELYMDALIDLPLILHPLARKRVAQSHRFTKLPTPGDFLKAVEQERTYLASQRAALLATASAARSWLRRNPLPQERML